MSICYSIHKIPKEGSFSLAITVKTSEGVLPCEKRSLGSIQDKKICESLIKDFNAHKNLKTTPLEYGKFDKVPVSFAQTSSFFIELAKVKEVFFDQKKIVIDALSKAKLFFEVDIAGDMAQILTYLIDGTSKYPLSEVEAFFGDDEVWILHKGVLKKLKHSFKWFKLGYFESILSEKKLENFLDHYEGELPLDSSIPEAKFTKKAQEIISPSPKLKLKNERGLFLDLYFDYQDKGEFLYLDPMNKWLNKQEELFWEELLIAAGIKKSGREYFVSSLDQEKVFKDLYRQGFVILTPNNLKVLILDRSKAVLEEGDQTSSLTLELKFGSLVADLEDIALSAKQNNPFVPLDDKHIGLIPLKLLSELEVLYKGSLFDQKCHFPSHLKGDFTLKYVAVEDRTTHEIAPINFDYFNLGLFDFQKKGVSWLVSMMQKHQFALLADDMGLGKTIQVLALIDLIRNSLPDGVLIVCPKSIKKQWENAIKSVLCGLDLKIEVATFHEIRAEDQKLFYSLIVIDEAQAIKNAKTQLFSKVCAIKSRYRLALTGTPIENSMSDLVSLFCFLNESIVKDFEGVSAVLNMMKIKKRLSPFILRRKKQEVLKELPQLFEQYVDVEMTEAQHNLYHKVIEEAKHTPIHVFSLLTKLRLIALDARLVEPDIDDMSFKTWQIIEDIASIVDSHQKVIVFSQFTSYLALLKKHLDEKNIQYAYLDGSTRDREKSLESFRQDTQVLLMSLKAGGVGLNLQMADYVLLADPWWNQASEQQAIDRAYRLGRKASVVAKRYYTLGTLEKKIEDLKHSKWALLDELSQDVEKPTLDILQLLLS